MRPRTSLAPPGAALTTSRTGLVGKVWADTTVLSAIAATPLSTLVLIVNLITLISHQKKRMSRNEAHSGLIFTHQVRTGRVRTTQLTWERRVGFPGSGRPLKQHANRRLHSAPTQ